MQYLLYIHIYALPGASPRKETHFLHVFKVTVSHSHKKEGTIISVNN